MQQYKNILTGMNTFSSCWFDSINKLNKENIIIFDFENNENLTNIITDKNIDYILPLSEKDYLIIKKCIHNNNKILYPSIENIKILDNKLFFTNFMLKNFKDYIPTVYYLNNAKLLKVKYPIISKPIYSINGNNMKIYYNDIEFAKCKDKIIIQQFIEYEYEYSAFMLCINGKIINWKIIKFKYKKYTIKKVNFPQNYENVENIDIQIFEPIIMKLNYTGGLCIDFKFNETANRVYIFEINPRFGGSAFSNNFIYELLCIKKSAF
jgi:carbamoylphosphate synthase large subunit